MNKQFKRIFSVFLMFLITGLSAFPVFAEGETGFLNPVDIQFPFLNGKGFIVDFEEELPTVGENGLIRETNVDLAVIREDGFLLEPENEMPKAGENGFILPLDKELPSASEGFLKEPSKMLPESGESGFIAEIGKASEDAKKITSEKELSRITSGKYVILNDIYLTEDWTPINPSGSVVLDGQGHKIHNLNIPSGERYAGLFGKASGSIKISNLGLSNSNGESGIYVSPKYGSEIYAGGFVASGNTILNNCFSNIPIKIEKSEGNFVYAGGLIGKSDGAITNCYYSGEITNEANSYDIYTGGLLAMGKSVISDCFNTASVKGAVAGGLVGSGGGSIIRSFNLGDFNGKLCGGLIGKASSILRVNDCYNKGNAIISGFTSSFNGAGGIIGECEKAVIDNCYNEGKISSESYGYTGGLVGSAAELEITFSYNKGNINYNTDNPGIEFNHPMGNTDYGTESGGLAGRCDKLTVTDSINCGAVGGKDSGGFLGYGELDAKYCVNEGIVAGISYSGGFSGCGAIRIENCVNKGDIYGAEHISGGESYYSRNYSKTGGISGGNLITLSGTASDAENRGYIKNCVNSGNIYVKNAEGYLTQQTYCGGIAGFSSAKISDCINKGNISFSEKENTFTDLCVGGILGSTPSGYEITRCINEGNLSGDSLYASGIVSGEPDSYEGKAPEKITACINRGNIDSKYNVKGIGDSDEITDCINLGKLSGLYAEGIGSGRFIFNSINKGNFVNVSGNISGIGYAVGIIAFSYNTGNGNSVSENAYGICQSAEDEISFCFNQGDFTVSEDGYGIAEIAVSITDCINKGNISGASYYCAGIGSADKITNCSNFGNLNSGRATTYGIGVADNILYCFNEGNLSASATNLNYEEEEGVRGIGVADKSIRFCINNGDISGENRGRLRGIGTSELISECINNGNVSGRDIAGIGIADEIKNCKNNGSFNEVYTGDEYYVKIRGIGDGSLIYNCVNSGNMRGYLCAGISGEAESVIACCNSGAIEGIDDKSTGAGIYSGKVASEIVNSFSTGRISNVSEGFGISGSGEYSAEAVSISNCFNQGNITASEFAVGIAKKAERILNSYNSGYTDGKEAYGLALYANEIINSCNKGAVYAELSGAGLVKEDFYQIVNCYNSGNVNVSDGVKGSGIALNNSKVCKIIDTVNCCAEVYVRASAPREKQANPIAGGILATVINYNTYLNNVKNTARISCHSNFEVTLGGICGYASSEYERIDNVYYEYPYLMIDKDTKNTGSLSYTCERFYDSAGNLTSERANVGAVVGNGNVGYTSVELPSDISISGTTLIIKGKTTPLTATVLPETGVDKKVIWTSDNPAVATVSTDGLVTGTGDGEAVISATTVNGLIAYHRIRVLGNAIEVNVFGYRNGEKYNGYPLPDAEVMVGDSVGYTDSNGSIIFDRSNLPGGASAAIKVSKGEDYKEYEDEILLLPTSMPKQTVNCFLEFIEEPIYFKKAIIKINNKETDLLKEKGITAVPLFDNKGQLSKISYPFDIEVEWRKCTENTDARKVFLRGVESGKTLSLGEGINYGCLAEVFEENEPIELVANTLDNEGGFVENAITLPLKVRMTNVKLEIPDTPTESLNKIDIMDDLSVGLSMGELTSGKIQIEFKNGVLKLKFLGGDEKEDPVSLKSFKGKRGISVSIGGEISIPLTDVIDGEWSGQVTAAVTQEVEARATNKKKDKDEEEKDKKVKLFEHRREMLISGIPCFFSFGLSAGAEASIGVCGPFDKISAGYGEIKVTGGASLKGGIGGKFTDDYQAEFGPKGEIEVELPAKISLDENFETKMEFDPVVKGKISAELIIKAKIIEIKGELKLGSFVWDKNGIEWDHIFEQDGKSGTTLFDIGNGIAPVGREYKEYGGGFNYGNSSGDAMLFAMDENTGREEKTLYSNIIRCADAGITVIDGSPVLMFTEDNLQRDEENGLTAAYSVYENGSWSQPVYINDDGTEDTGIKADGRFAVWEDTAEVLEGGYTLDELLSLTEISAGVYNGNGYDSLRLTDDGIYDFGGKVKDLGNKGVVAWLSNSEGDVSCESGITSLNYSVYDEGWSERAVVENIGKVTNINIVSDGDNPFIIYKDSENDLYSYNISNGDYKKIMSGVGRYDAEFVGGKLLVSYFDEESVLHITIDGEEIKTVETEFLGSENPIIAAKGDIANIFWIEESGIYYVTNAGGDWSDLLCFNNAEERLSGLDCVFTNGENYILTYFSHGENTTDLKSIEASLGKDVMLSGINAEENAPITAYLLNNGEKNIENVSVSIEEEGEIVFSSDYDITIPPGERKELQIDFSPENENVIHNYNISVFCEGDYHEENNSDYFSLGRKDIEISDCGFKEGGIYREQLYADITNSGTVPVESSVLRIYKGREKEELISEVEFGELKAGETAPFTLDMVQEENAIYYITIETKDDGDISNNSGMICDDRIKERESSLIYNKESKTLTATIVKSETSSDKGELIWVVYSPKGCLETIIKDEFEITQDKITTEKVLDISAGSRVKVMFWQNLSSAIPSMQPIETIITN